MSSLLALGGPKNGQWLEKQTGSYYRVVDLQEFEFSTKINRDLAVDFSQRSVYRIETLIDPKTRKTREIFVYTSISQLEAMDLLADCLLTKFINNET